MDDVLGFFRETQEAFTVYVVEQRFVTGRGLDYFKSFQGKINYIDSNSSIRKRIHKILRWLQKNIPAVADLVASSLTLGPTYDVADALTILNKLFSVHNHQAAGPEVIDPIIIQEDKIEQKYITQIITLHEKSFLQPVIIILLKDNDFDRAKAILSHCPHGMNIKFVRNSGNCEIWKVINTGANNISSFMDAFAQQCFSTCSHTPRHILLNDTWAKDSLIQSITPSLLRIRSNLIMDEKETVRPDIENTLMLLGEKRASNSKEDVLLKYFNCIVRLMRVFCNDTGNQDIETAYHLAEEVNDPLLLAQVYRYAYFLNQYSATEQIELLSKAEKTFSDAGLEDQALYCKNNRLTYQFEQERIHLLEFHELQGEAVSNVPGLVGMSHILNNTGVAYLMTGSPDLAAPYFAQGMKYASRQERTVQRLAIICNHLIVRSYCYETIDQNELRRVMDQIMDAMGFRHLPFISARLAMNIMVIAAQRDPSFGKDLLHHYPIMALVQKAFDTNLMGSGMLVLQLQYLSSHFPFFKIPEGFRIPLNPISVKGLHREFIVRHGYNPFVFCTWL